MGAKITMLQVRNIVALPGRRGMCRNRQYPSVIESDELGPYSAAQALHIADAIARNPRGGAITLRVVTPTQMLLSAGGDSKRRGFEVRWETRLRVNVCQ